MQSPRLPVVLVFCSLFGCHTAATPSPVAHEPPRIRLTFAPASDSFQTAAREYDSLSVSDGDRIIRALQRAAGLTFAAIGDTVIGARVLERASSSGYRERPMELRASYPTATKAALALSREARAARWDSVRKSRAR